MSLENPVKWNELSPEQQKEFTMDGLIEQENRFLSDGAAAASDNFWPRGRVDDLVRRAMNHEECHYPRTDRWLYSALDNYSIKGKSVAILGSAAPFYEAVCLSYGGIPTTIEYNKIYTDDPRLTVMTVNEYNNNPTQFDMAFSISSFEHDGLGRFGDPIDPVGDLKAMQNVKDNILKKDGLLFVAIPVGIDTVSWNAHRIYGEHRFSKFIDGFELIDSFGFHSGLFNLDSGRLSKTGQELGMIQPIFVLKNNEGWRSV